MLSSTLSPPLVKETRGLAHRYMSAPETTETSRISTNAWDARLLALSCSLAPSAREMAVETPTPSPAPMSRMTQYTGPAMFIEEFASFPSPAHQNESM